MNKNGLAEKLKTNLQNIQFGRSEDPFGWRIKLINLKDFQWKVFFIYIIIINICLILGLK